MDGLQDAMIGAMPLSALIQVCLDPLCPRDVVQIRSKTQSISLFIKRFFERCILSTTFTQ